MFPVVQREELLIIQYGKDNTSLCCKCYEGLFAAHHKTRGFLSFGFLNYDLNQLHAQHSDLGPSGPLIPTPGPESWDPGKWV